MLSNWQFKILAVVISSLLYLFVNSQSNNTEVKISIPVEVKNLPKNLLITEPTDRRAQVTIVGPSYQIASASTSNLSFSVSLPNNITDQYEVILNQNQINLPKNVTIRSIEPNSLLLRFEQELQKQVRIEIPTVGKIRSDLKLVAVTADPPQATIRGPETVVSRIKEIKTKAFDLRQIFESGSTDLTLQNPNPAVALSPASIKATYDLVSLITEKVLTGLPVSKNMPDAELYELVDNKIDLRVRGTKQTLAELKPETLQVSVSAMLKNKTEKLVRPKISGLPTGISVVSSEPADLLLRKKEFAIVDENE